MEETLEQKVKRIEDILYSYSLHEPFCSVYKAISHNSKGQTYMLPGECTCWQSQERGI